MDYIKKTLGASIACIKCSDFYKPLLGKHADTDINMEEELKIDDAEDSDSAIDKINKTYNFDSPDAIDFGMLVEGLKKLKKGESFSKPKYNKKLKVREDTWQTVDPCDVVIVEGHLIFSNKDLLDMFDLKIYVDADDDVRLSRRILKEKKEAEKDGKFDVIKCLNKYEKFVKPAHEKYVEPTKKFADMFIPNYGFTIEELNVEKQFVCKPALDLIIKEIKARTGFD